MPVAAAPVGDGAGAHPAHPGEVRCKRERCPGDWHAPGLPRMAACTRSAPVYSCRDRAAGCSCTQPHVTSGTHMSL